MHLTTPSELIYHLTKCLKKGKLEHLLVDQFLSRWREFKEGVIEFMFHRPINNNNSLEYPHIPCDTFINILSAFKWFIELQYIKP